MIGKTKGDTISLDYSSLFDWKVVGLYYQWEGSVCHCFAG